MSRKDLTIFQPQQDTPYQSEHTEVVTAADGQQFTIPRQPRQGHQPPTIIQNVYISGDYHYRDDSAALAVWESKRDRKHRRQREIDRDREAREDRRERAADRHARIELGMFAGYILTLIILFVVAVLGTMAMSAIGLVHH